MNRRSDHALRQTISNIESLLVNSAEPQTILSRCAEELLYLLDGEYSFSYYTDGDNPNVWELAGVYRSDTAGACQPSIRTATNIDEELVEYLSKGRSLFGSGVLPDVHPLPTPHPDIHNYFCLPIQDATHLYGVVYICNTGKLLDGETGLRLRPFVTAVACLLRLGMTKERTVKQQQNISMSLNLLGILDALFNGVVLLDENERIVLCNKAAARMLGARRRELVGLSMTRFIPKGTGYGIRMTTDVVADGGNIWRGVALHAFDGEKRLVDITVTDLKSHGTVHRGLVLEDISDRLKSAAAYQSAMQRFHALTSLAPVGMMQLNADWECTYVNDTWCDYLQATTDEMLGVGWMNIVHRADADRFLADMRRETAASGRYNSELRFQTALGMVLYAKVSACALYDETGDLDGLIVTCHDITEHLKTERRLREAAETDQLTGLANRSHFNTRLDCAMEEAHRYGTVALMFIDLDNFKSINDTLGHDAGDSLLIEVAERLRNALRKVDTISRIGGDEFTVLLTHVNSDQAVKMIAEKLLSALGQPFVLMDRSIYVTCSIGIAVYEEDMTRQKLIKQADIALYKAKDSGRNQYRFFTPELNKDAGLLINLRQSLKERRSEDFRMVYQPQVDADTGKIIGLEALARWTDPDTGPVSPDVFIKLLEQTGLIDEFSLWAFEEVFQQSLRWKTHLQSGLKVALNLSARQFKGNDLVYSIQELCKKYNLSPKHFAFEVTETAFISDTNLASDVLNRLQKLGFSISLDDFGTGYSSLMYLRSMPLSSVKIDRSFTKDVIDDEEDAKIVSGILSLAEALELNVVAEGVETDEIKAWLTERGCSVHQGYLYHRPAEAQEVTDLLAKNQ